MSDVKPDLQEIFCEALGLQSQEERSRFLDSVCADDQEIRAKVDRLLVANEQAGEFLPGASPADEATTDEASVERVGARIGPYKLLEPLGEGAFGTVYMADQREPVRRKVALKVLKPGMDTKSLVARFDAEKQALAMMDHPNIARVFDAGTTPSGRPYFVMELVKGLPITQYADAKNLTTEQRLKLFISVCHAVQHAHQKGIIHRDIKPSNVMVARHDDQPVVKVIDFGIAKALHQPLTEKTLFTGFGQIVGTVLYMSPEQAELNSLDVDTRSDVYSLGVLLYELLTGVTPHDRKRLLSAAFDEMRNIIRHEEPPRPSTRISSLGNSATEICEHRQTEPARLSALIRGDLDWIVMKTLEKERTRRYDTAKDLADDIEHYLAHEPVEASSPSPIYRVRKFVRRNRAGVGMVTAVVLLAFVLFGNLWYGSLATARAKTAELQASVDRQKQLDEARRRRFAEQNQRQAERRENDLKWRNSTMVTIKKQRDQEEWSAAFLLAEQLKQKYSSDEEVDHAWREVSCVCSIVTDEPGALVSIQRYDQGDAEWQKLGATPVDRRVARGVYRWKIDMPGYTTLEGIVGPEDSRIVRAMVTSEQSDPQMVPVAALSESGQRTMFLIDRYEIRNRDFADFVAQGGYHTKKHWVHPFREGGNVLTFEEAIAKFRDSTDRVGPANWANGTYLPKQADYPVSGISWYEAAAYADWAGKSLPTLGQWRSAASVERSSVIVPQSHFGGAGPVEVGRYRGVSSFGAYDMAGNVTEWCVNSTTNGRRCTLGGAYNTTSYMFNYLATYHPFDRLPDVGFRCVRIDGPAAMEGPSIVNVNKEVGTVSVPPAPSADELKQWLAEFDYDQNQPFHERVSPPEDIGYYSHEVVHLDAAYDGPELKLHLFVPKGGEQQDGNQQFQTIVCFPGIGAMKLPSFDDNRHLIDRQFPLGLVTKGCVVCWPEYRGTFGRGAEDGSSFGGSKGYDRVVEQVKDLRRTVDYLCSRSDLDTTNLVYYGLSWGANIGPLMTVAEPRIAAAVFVAGALWPNDMAKSVRYVSHVNIPVLMINCPEDKTANRVAMFEHLGSLDKKQKLLGTGHLPPVNETSDLIDDWLAERFENRGLPATGLQTAETQIKTGEIQLHRKRYAEAERCFRTAGNSLAGEWGEEHPDVWRVRAKMLEAIAKQQVTDDLITRIEATLAAQLAFHESDHPDVRATGKVLVDACVDRAWNLCLRKTATDGQRQEALRLATRSTELSPETTTHLLLMAFAQFRLGNEAAALAYANESLGDPNTDWVGHWLLLAMLHHSQSDDDIASDWYSVASEWIRKKSPKGQTIYRLRNEAADRLGLPVVWPPDSWTTLASLKAHTRLIDANPNVARLYHQRGSHHGRLGDWEKAVADYSEAMSRNSTRFRSREAHAAVTLYAGDADQRLAAMEGLLAVGRNHDNPNSTLDVVVACCLTGDAANRIPELEEMATSAVAKLKPHAFLNLARSILLYRLGRYEEALSVFPAESLSNPKDELLALIFRAMTHHQLGDAYTCRKLLERANATVASQLPNPDGPALPYQDRPVVWCMVQTVLREAETLIQTPAEAQSHEGSKLGAK